MYIAMNRFKVLKDQTKAFEAVWLNRDSQLEKVPGFIEFHLLKGPECEDHILYASHTIWATEDAFKAWTNSEHFRKAHAHAGNEKPKTLGHPQFEGFHVLQTAKNPHRQAAE